MKTRRVSKRKIFFFISYLIFFSSILVYGVRFIHYYRIERQSVVEDAK